MFSPNMLKTFQSCPKKYWFKYIQKISTPQKASFFEKGKKIHALANYYLRGDDISKFENVLNVDEQKVWQTLKNNEFFQKSYINSEYNLSCKIGEFWIGGRLDALVKDENNYCILDYKTGSVPKNPEYDFQTMVYLLCAQKKYGSNIKFVYIDLKNNQNCIVELTPEKASEYEKIITKICNEITDFEPVEDNIHTKQCEFCEYKKICF